MKESYTSRSKNCKILKNYQPMLGLDHSDSQYMKIKDSNKSTTSTSKDTKHMNSFNHSKMSMNPLHIAERLNQKLKKFTKLSDLSNTSINHSKL